MATQQGVSVHAIVDDAATLRALENLTTRELNAAVRKGVAKSTTEARKLAKGAAPRRTGTLQKAISKVTRSRQGLSYGKVYVRPEGYYGYFVEHGTVNMAPEPFMSPSETKVTPLVPGLIEIEISAAIAKKGL